MFRVGPGWYRSIRRRGDAVAEHYNQFDRLFFVVRVHGSSLGNDRRGDAVAEHYNQFDRLFFRGSSPWIFTGQRPLARGL